MAAHRLPFIYRRRIPVFSGKRQMGRESKPLGNKQQLFLLVEG
jgi:hypothetical protein